MRRPGSSWPTTSTPRMRRSSNASRSEEHTSELQSLRHLVCRLLLEKKVKTEVARDDRIFGIADKARIILNASARLERPAVVLVFVQMRALARRRGLGHLCLDLLDRL